MKTIFISTLGFAALVSMSARADSGAMACFKPARDWFYSNTSRGSEESINSAIKLCKGGTAETFECFKEARDWFYSNTSRGSEDSINSAIALCSPAN